MDFGAELRAIDGGCLLEDLGDVLREIRAKAYKVAEQEGEATGTITIKLKVKATREHKGKGNFTIKEKLTPTVTKQEPALPRASGYKFLDEDGTASNSDPRQGELDFEPRVVAGGKVDVDSSKAAASGRKA